MLCRATHDGQVMVESSDKMRSTGEESAQQTASPLDVELCHASLKSLLQAKFTSFCNSSTRHTHSEPPSSSWAPFKILDLDMDTQAQLCPEWLCVTSGAHAFPDPDLQ